MIARHNVIRYSGVEGFGILDFSILFLMRPMFNRLAYVLCYFLLVYDAFYVSRLMVY